MSGDLSYADTNIVKYCDECRTFMKQWCRVWFDARTILECLAKEKNRYKILERKPNSIFIQNLYKCYDNPHYYIHIYCKLDYLRVRFYEGDKNNGRGLFSTYGGVIKNLICEWEVNEPLTYELITTLQYRVNRYLIDNGYNLNFYNEISWLFC